MGRVKKVDLYENGTIAIVEAVSPELGNRVQRVRVQLPGTSQVGTLFLMHHSLKVIAMRGLSDC